MGNVIYILVLEDKHIDVAVHPFTDKDTAISNAKHLAKKYAREEGDYEEHDYGRNEGWVFFAQYSFEGDCVRVVEVEMDKWVD